MTQNKQLVLENAETTLGLNQSSHSYRFTLAQLIGTSIPKSTTKALLGMVEIAAYALHTM